LKKIIEKGNEPASCLRGKQDPILDFNPFKISKLADEFFFLKRPFQKVLLEINSSGDFSRGVRTKIGKINESL